ncbi:hypothetical protein [Rhodococcus sp. 077-4]|uniref:hypothetical protein n=1 Tax=Rhodococcus sp. 077-4 TaxID=2789271 RepID=UPI0039F500A4
MTTNLIERESDKTWTGGWTALGGALMLVTGFATYWALSNPVATDLLMGFDYAPSARTGLRVGTGFAVIAWFASFITSLLGMRRSAAGRIMLGCLVILALVLIGPVLLFCAAIAFTS